MVELTGNIGDKKNTKKIERESKFHKLFNKRGSDKII